METNHSKYQNLDHPSFIYLTAFSTQGGIEKFNRSFLKALQENFPTATGMSLYDKKEDVDERYFPKERLVAASSFTILSVIKLLLAALFSRSDSLIFGHINLAILAGMIRKLSPGTKTILIAHGVEVWGQLTTRKQKFLQNLDEIWAVSSYTKKRLVEEKGILADKIKIFHNCMDPFFEKAQNFQKPIDLLEYYSLSADTLILFTLCRLSAAEGYKGYDTVLQALPLVLKNHPKLCYIIAGKYDRKEKQRLDEIIRENGLGEIVIFTGFLPDEQIMPHYLLADLFVMPSRNEGFGIVFLEAMRCGLPVIAGNSDGSVDALKNGELGTLVNPESRVEIAEAIIDVLNKPKDEKARKELQKAVMQNFSFEQFKARQMEYLNKIEHR